MIQKYHASEIAYQDISKSSKKSVWGRIWVLEKQGKCLNTKAFVKMVIAKLNILQAQRALQAKFFNLKRRYKRDTVTVTDATGEIL